MSIANILVDIVKVLTSQSNHTNHRLAASHDKVFQFILKSPSVVFIVKFNPNRFPHIDIQRLRSSDKCSIESIRIFEMLVPVIGHYPTSLVHLHRLLDR